MYKWGLCKQETGLAQYVACIDDCSVILYRELEKPRIITLIELAQIFSCISNGSAGQCCAQ